MLLNIHEEGQTPLPHEVGRPIVGIDLGTTHSLVAAVKDGKPYLVVDKTPSVVAFDGHDFVVGQRAMDLPHALHSVKRLMKDPATQCHELSVNQKPINPILASSIILSHLKKEAEGVLGHDIKEIVLTVPAYFDDTARTATRDAARLAGLEVVRMLNEPTAAALAYGLEHQAQGLYGIYDLGGGTFDFSILTLEDKVFQVLATGGHTTLGGDDFDALVAKLLPTPVNALTCRGLKEQLSHHDRVTHDGITITRQDFDKLASPLVDQTLGICQEILKDAQLSPGDLKGIVMVGGSTRVPLVIQKVRAFFHKEPLQNVDPDAVVALGAAQQGESLCQGSGTLLLDVCPLSLGLEMMGGTVEKVIHRHSPIPTSVSQEFTTYQDNQTALLIHVLQGERELVGDCRSLAKFELKGIPPGPAGHPRIQVTFTLDADGLLSVSAKEMKTGIIQSVEVRPSHGLSPQETERMITQAYENAGQDHAQKTLREAVIEGERLARAVSVALSADGGLLDDGERGDIAKTLSQLQESIQGSCPQTIQDLCKTLEEKTQDFAERRLNHQLKKALAGYNAHKG